MHKHIWHFTFLDNMSWTMRVTNRTVFKPRTTFRFHLDCLIIVYIMRDKLVHFGFAVLKGQQGCYGFRLIRRVQCPVCNATTILSYKPNWFFYYLLNIYFFSFLFSIVKNLCYCRFIKRQTFFDRGQNKKSLLLRESIWNRKCPRGR